MADVPDQASGSSLNQHVVACRVAEAAVKAINSRWPIRIGVLPVVPEHMTAPKGEHRLVVSIANCAANIIAIDTCCPNWQFMTWSVT